VLTSLQHLLDSGSEAMLIVDRSGAIVLTNKRALDLFGYSPRELEGQLVEQLVPARLRYPHIGHQLAFTDSYRARPMAATNQLFALCKDGTERSVTISLQSVPYGLQTLVIAIIRTAGA
jgi:PAS domain S-box-containing protein